VKAVVRTSTDALAHPVAAPEVTGHDAVAALTIARAAIRSADEGHPVGIKEVA
jgi:predicted dehydrogenase